MISYRLATDHDLPAVADLRWRLQTYDGATWDEAERLGFIGDFVDLAQADPRASDVFHWVGSEDGCLVGAMTVILVRKVPKPGELDRHWGYLTNCYVAPEKRDQGVGASLLAVIKSWATELGLEMLVVWPSDRAYPFYERAGFLRGADPLVLEIAPR